MNFGVHLPQAGPTASARGLLEVACEAERAGFASVWLFDHLFTPTRGAAAYPFAADGVYAFDPGHPYLDSVGIMGAIAAVTSTVEIGVRVMVAAYRHPVVLAKELTTIDHVADGRLLLGIGAGWMPEEFDAVDLPMARRAARMDEHVALMRNAWHDGVASFDGEFYSHVEAGFLPRPPRGTIPILVGGYGNEALRRVATWGDGWAIAIRNEATIANPHVAPSPDDVADRLEVLRTLCAEVGRDYDELRLVANVSPREDVVVLREYAELGIHDCDVVIWGDDAKVTRELHRFADTVGVSI